MSNDTPKMTSIVNGFTRSISFTAAYDKRHSEPEKNYGVHGVDMYFSLEKDNKGISFMLFTGWMLPHVAAEFRGQKYFGEPVPCMVSSHDDKPGYEGQVPRMDCHIRGEGNPCYGDGSGLLATEAFDALVIGGEEGLWKFLEKKYVDWISHE